MEEYTVINGANDAGEPIFSLLVKRSYAIHPGQPPVRLEQPAPLVKVDEYYDHGDPEWAPVKFETDLTPFKVATDVVAVGAAYAPRGRPALQIEAAVEVAGRRKAISIIGDRECRHRGKKTPLFTEPAEFTVMPLRYDRAYGGYDRLSNPAITFAYPRNPVGVGLAVKNLYDLVEGLRLPNLEDPEEPLTPETLLLEEYTRWNQQPLPQGFGWFHRAWYPRCSFVGSMPAFVGPDDIMREELLGLVPENQVVLARQFKLPSFDIRFNNGASYGLTMPYLSGGEIVRLTNLTPAGSLEFPLPLEQPHLMLDIGLGENELQPVLHTVCICPDEGRLDLVWRGAHLYPGIDWLPEMKRLQAVAW